MSEIKTNVHKVTTHTVTTTKHKIEIGREELFGLLRLNYPELENDARICITVPGGGNWSNTALDIGVDVDLEVEWTTTEDSSS